MIFYENITFFIFFNGKIIFSDFLKNWSSYFVKSNQNDNSIVSVMLVNKSEIISSQTRAIHKHQNSDVIFLIICHAWSLGFSSHNA